MIMLRPTETEQRAKPRGTVSDFIYQDLIRKYSGQHMCQNFTMELEPFRFVL